MSKIKEELFRLCCDFVDERIRMLEGGLKSAQEAANNETKSSAGDKYETGRAMMHLEKEKLSSQLSEALKMKKVLSMMDISKSNSIIDLGSLVKTDTANYFISISAGQLKIEDKIYFALSPVSPIGQQLVGKTEKDEISFAGKTQRIEEVC